ncbi:site-specific DNA-methyltransferase [Micrococcus luteus]|uniref:site-specific DNA-methyltransferase n=1 Tax=Micrococcus luteus TaxID=1270 RepID=UPI0022B54623|nr:DNA methyltransferase [Micrococcus luteus]MCZ6937141.1 site-specific DNA-methyltransferase [Micrococcus luteus]
MSRLTDLLAQARKTDPQLAADLEAEFRQLTQRSQFGLVFERHQPEAVELPGRPVRRGDTVRVLPPRGTLTIGDTRHWVVTDLERTPDGKQAHLTEADVDPEVREPATSTAALEDLVVVARFEDPIYPGLVETGRVENGGDKPFHTVINAENFHALEMLTYTHRHKVDCIYIDPPYNTRAKDWKYNNDYVEADDDYRHSKWLSFMERRLKVARELLNPKDSVLIVTIDEKEYLRLGMLIEQTFPGALVTMVSSNINPGGSTRRGTFARAVEYIYFVQHGASVVQALPLDTDWDAVRNSTKHAIHWHPLQRTGQSRGNTRAGRPKLFYPIFVQQVDGDAVFHSVGDPVEGDASDIAAPEGCAAVLPIRKDGSEGCWGVGPESLRALINKGYARLGKWKAGRTPIYFLQEGMVKKVEAGDFKAIGNRPDGSVITNDSSYQARFIPEDMWRIGAHDASRHGSNLLRALMPDRKFPFPKSLYAVRDAIRFFVDNKPDAVVLDFFSGSATTAHAVMLLNRLDGGRRQCISVTNNEVSADEQQRLRKQGLRPGDLEWEALGICDYITKPRVTAAITGQTPSGTPIKGSYRFTDEFPMAEGLEENAAFFTLTYEAPRQVRRNRAFARVAPMLWLKAGSRGRIIFSLPEQGWDVAQAYGVLEDMDHAPEFLAALEDDPQVGMAFIVTDSEVAFQSVARQLPEHTTAVRLYESYLHNFQINRRA